MFVIYTSVILTLFNNAASHKEYPPLSKFCHVKDITENECNKCVCTPNYIYECNSKPCNETGTLKTVEKWCQPNMLYVRNLTVCLCNENGSWPHENCKTIFKSFPIKTKQTCEPNSYVIIDHCNVCKCGADSTIDEKHCTKNECSKINITIGRRFMKQDQVYGSCKANNWYSLAPCQFCYCISESKLVCNTGNNYYAKRLQLGSYNLNVCGTDLVKDAIDLIPDREKTLRFGDKIIQIETKSKYSESTDKYTTSGFQDRRPYIELNRENNENVNEQREKKQSDSDEYYTESEESKVAMGTIGREGSSTKLPYEDDENNDVSEDKRDQSGETETEISVPIDPQTSIQNVSDPPVPVIGNYPQLFEWNSLTPKSEKLPTNDEFTLGDVLKPYLPVVLDKVFQMASRKSIVSVENHANCSPGATTVFKCNSCFCMKNNKLLCTKNPCKT